MNSLKNFFSTYLLFITTLFYGVAQGNVENVGVKNVLYISSNHDSYYPSSEILSGITNYFKGHQLKIDLKTIYLNSRYIHNKEIWHSTVISEMNKLIDKQIDLVIVAGAEAISGIDTLDDPRLRNTPTVYCGTLSLKDVKKRNITGVLLNYRYDEVLSIAQKMYPHLENVYLIGDQSNYSNQLVQTAQQQLAKFSYKYNIIVNTDLKAVNDVLIYLKSLPKNSFVVMLNWQKTKNNDFCDWTIYYPVFAQNSLSPMYRHVRDLENEDYAIAPNRYLYKHGQEVGAIGFQLLRGTPASEIPIKSPKIDWSISEKWLIKENIDSEVLPSNVTVITEKQKKDQSAIYLTLTLAFCIPILILISQLLFKKKKIRKNTESILILQNEVNNILKQFEDEHAVLDGLLSETNHGALIIEVETNRVINANHQIAKILNLPLDEVFGRKIDEIMPMRQGEIAVDINGYIRSVITTGKKIEFSTKEMYVVCRNGKKVQCNGSFSLLSRHNGQEKELTGVLLMIRDIGGTQIEHERINECLRALNMSTWTLNIANQNIVFKEGEDPLNRSTGTSYSIETLAQYVINEQRREFHTFWTDLVRSEQSELRMNVLIDFPGNGKYESWLFIGFSQQKGTIVFGSMIKSLPQTEHQDNSPNKIEHWIDDPFIERNINDAATNRADKATILIAEDNDSNFLLISKLLKGKYNLFRAKNGEQAIVLAKKENPDLILMDMNMPILDGASATKVIRSKDQTTPIFALTASAYDSDKLKTIEAGCTGYLSKPVNKEALFSVLEQYCGY